MLRAGLPASYISPSPAKEDAIASHEQSEELARAALTAYDLPSDARITHLASGLNTTFTVSTADRRYVLRVHRPGYRTVANTRAELTYVGTLGKALQGTGVDVPQPMRTRDGDLVVAVADDQHCDLLTWVDGQVRRPENGLDVPAVQQLGRALALMHNAAAEIAAPFDLPRWDAEAMFTAAASPFRPLLDISEILSPTDRADFEDLGDRTQAVFDALESDFGIIHFDYILGNVHLSRGSAGWQVGVIDFDDCGYGHYLYDMCPMLGNLAGYPAGEYNTNYPVLRDAFLRGYRSSRPLPAEWERHLPVLMAARHANHCFLTAGLNVSDTPGESAAWRMSLARLSLQLPV
jgi:Ser/Thr protein kinase RdoA (MazF antagonist)